MGAGQQREAERREPLPGLWLLGVALALPWGGRHLDRLLGPPPPGVMLLTGMMSSVPWSARNLCSVTRVSPVQVPLWAAQGHPEAGHTPSKG